MILIGLAGTNGSGKDTIAHMLAEKYGFCFAGATEMLAAELKQRGLPTDRVHKSKLSAEWRREHGMAAIVDKGVILFESGDYQGLIVGSLRHPGEADRVHELGGTMLWIDADPHIRYERIIGGNRGRIEDQKSFEEFLADEAREMKPEGDAATLNMGAVKERADIFIQNDGNDIEAFKLQAEKALQNAGLL
jgi:cytidylate kinase